MLIPFGCMVKFQFLAQFAVDPFSYPVVPTLVLFSACLLHSLLMWLTASLLSPHNQPLLFCCVLSIFVLIKLIFMAFCAVRTSRIINISCPWCNGYRRRKWTRRYEFKSWTRMIAFHIALIPLGKVWIQLFSLQLWVNSRTDWVLQPWWGN